MESVLEYFLAKNPEDEQLYSLANNYVHQENYIKAIEVIEDSISIRGRDKVPAKIHNLQGEIFYKAAEREKNDLIKLVFYLAASECFSIDSVVPALLPHSFYNAAGLLGSLLYYKKALKAAEESLSFIKCLDQSVEGQTQTKDILNQTKSILEQMIAKTKSFILDKPEARLMESTEEVQRTTRSGWIQKRLRSAWSGMNVESKRNFFTVSTEKLRGYVEEIRGEEEVQVFEQVLKSATDNKKWKFWMCRTCSETFFNLQKFKNHLEQEHAARFKPSTTNQMPQRVEEKWAYMVSLGAWEPVDAVAATDLIKTRLELVKEFVYENGWSKDWPLAFDRDRSKVLKEIQGLLVSFWKSKIFPSSIRKWLQQFSVKHLAQFETECRPVETPQIICFLECRELSQMLCLLKQVEAQEGRRNDGTDLICKAVNSLWNRTRVKEKIEFDHEFSVMLLDKRLLRGEIDEFDDVGAIDVRDHNVYFAKTDPQGDDVITWLLDCPSKEDCFACPRSIRSYNLDIWVAVLRVIHLMCRTLETKHAKKLEILSYHEALIKAKKLCVSEDERRSTTPEDEGNTYASLLVDECDELWTKVKQDVPLRTKEFLCATRDVLEKALHPAFDYPDPVKHLSRLQELKNVSNDIVLNSIDHLNSEITNKVPLLDSKILLIESSRFNLLNGLSKLSIFDYRFYILRLLKRYLRKELDGTMDPKTKLAAPVELFSEKNQEKGKNPGSKKKKPKSKERTSTSMSSLLDQKVEHESSVHRDSRVPSPSLETVEEQSTEKESTLSSERGGLEISSSTDNQEEAAKDMPNTPEEGSLSKQLELAHGTAAVRCNSALDMTLEALCNIKVLKEELLHNRHLFPDNPEGKVSCALQNFLSAFVSKQINEEGDYSHLLRVLLASLEKVSSMPIHAAEFLVSILEFWPCWKSAERESLVTSLFVLEEYEIMSCSKCRRKPNYPEQSSYGIVMAADSIRDLKCAFGNINFEDILKVIRMEDKMLCDTKRGGCGKANFVYHFISRRPLIFTIVLEWEKDETEKEISETVNALNWEIDISRLYEDLDPNTEHLDPNKKYRLVSVVGCTEEKENLCLAYRENQWFSCRHESLAKEAVGNWKNVVKFCGERKVRPEILFYEAFQWPNK